MSREKFTKTVVPVPIIAYDLRICHIYFKPFLTYKITHKVDICSKVGNATLNRWRWPNQAMLPPTLSQLVTLSIALVFWSRLAGAGKGLKEGKEQETKIIQKLRHCTATWLGSIVSTPCRDLVSWDICKDCKRDQTSSSSWENGLKTHEAIYKLTSLSANQWTFSLEVPLFASSREQRERERELHSELS